MQEALQETGGGGKGAVDEIWQKAFGKLKDQTAEQVAHQKGMIAEQIKRAIEGVPDDLEALAKGAEGTRFGKNLRFRMVDMMAQADERDHREWAERQMAATRRSTS